MKVTDAELFESPEWPKRWFAENIQARARRLTIEEGQTPEAKLLMAARRQAQQRRNRTPMPHQNTGSCWIGLQAAIEQGEHFRMMTGLSQSAD